MSWRIRRRKILPAVRPWSGRLRYAYVITCREAGENAAGEVVELRCTYDPGTRGGNAPEGTQGSKGTSPWGRAKASKPAEVAYKNQLFTNARPTGARVLPPTSIRSRWRVLERPALSWNWRAKNQPSRFNSRGRGYFVATTDSTPDRLVFNPPSV